MPSGTVRSHDALSVELAFFSMSWSAVAGLELYSLPLSDFREKVVSVNDRFYKERLLPKSTRTAGGFRGLVAILQAQ